MLQQLAEFLVEQRAGRRLMLLVIDEAQNLSLPALEEMRMLSNLETEKSKLMQIILVGQPDLREKLRLPELEQLRQRVTVSYHLEPLDGDDTRLHQSSAESRRRRRAARVPADVTALDAPPQPRRAAHHQCDRRRRRCCSGTARIAAPSTCDGRGSARGARGDGRARVRHDGDAVAPLAHRPLMRRRRRRTREEAAAAQAERAASAAIDAARDAALRRGRASCAPRRGVAEQQRVIANRRGCCATRSAERRPLCRGAGGAPRGLRSQRLPEAGVRTTGGARPSFRGRPWRSPHDRYRDRAAADGRCAVPCRRRSTRRQGSWQRVRAGARRRAKPSRRTLRESVP